MSEPKYISVTELSRNASKTINEINEVGQFNVLKNNQPVAVILSYDLFMKLAESYIEQGETIKLAIESAERMNKLFTEVE